jgi:TatD DNase family protein
VGEVGLDGGSSVPSADQRRVCAEVLDIVSAMPRLLSLHSVRAHTPLLALLHSAQVRGAVLHWWTGSDGQTARALDLGCWFSVGPRMVRHVDRLARFPRDRVLTETDAAVMGAVAGRVDDVEAALATVWTCDIADVRAQIWRNFATLVDMTKTRTMLPVSVQKLVAEVAPIA